MNGAKNKTSAPYGQACAQCVQAKSRCMSREEGPCERCHRLSKECLPSSSVRKRSNKGLQSASKRAQLEEKLDDLVSLLRTQQNAPQAVLQSATPQSMSLSPPQGHSTDDTCNVLTDEELLHFRTRHLPMYPLMYLPATITAAQLSAEKPLVALAFKTISNKGISYQAELSKQLRQTIATKMIVDGEKSLDLLQSILVVMTWSLYFTAGKQFLVMMAGLARTLLNDLRLDRPQTLGTCPSVMPYAEVRTPRTNEARRALVSCFTMTAMIAATFKSDPMPWSSQIDQDCEHLATAGESEGDIDLTIMTRIAHVVVQAAEVSHIIDDSSTSTTDGSLHIPLLLASLDRVKSRPTMSQLKQDNISAVLAATEVAIYELALLVPTTPLSQTSTILQHKRTSYLMSCFQICKDCTENHLAIDIVTFTTPTKLIFAYSLKVLHRLCTLEDVGWDPAIARQSVNLVSLLERCAASAEDANARLKEVTGEDSVFAVASVSLRGSAANWVMPSLEPQSGSATVGAWVGSEGFDLPAIDFSDDFWLTSSLNI